MADSHFESTTNSIKWARERVHQAKGIPRWKTS
ncbi:hypothetical protein CCACVL1_17841 [Corchorus capsularis]|uniref:Uncharacterized protein n=1 Tax=Corchorus capsularis TaxID=210143 RepID=A0A1R3HPN6_COCAP|nr:hypothetical protein CCACVL1_17841 [Corchorus capsularis]